MPRHILVSLVVAVSVSVCVLWLASSGFFAPAAQGLFDWFRAERLLKAEAVQPAWLHPGAIVLGASGIAWIASDVGAWIPKAMMAGVAILFWACLSLTGTFYGLLFDPFPPMAASALSLIVGLAVAESPGSRSRENTRSWLQGRVSRKTLADILDSPLQFTTHPESRELSVVACRLEPQTAAEPSADALDAGRLLLDEATDFLRGRHGALLDFPEADGVRAIFGILPAHAASHTSHACEAALGLEHCLRQFGELSRHGGRPVPRFGLGVSSGPLCLGLHGPASHPAVSAAGNPVDHARHLAALTFRHHAGILLGGRAARMAGDQFETRRVDGESFFVLAGRTPPPAEEIALPDGFDVPEEPVAREPAAVPPPASAGPIEPAATPPPPAHDSKGTGPHEESKHAPAVGQPEPDPPAVAGSGPSPSPPDSTGPLALKPKVVHKKRPRPLGEPPG